MTRVTLLLALMLGGCPYISGDADHDGYRSISAGGDDCDDSDAAVNPAATEVCNGVDDDCSGGVDNDVAEAPVWFLDGDGDDYGDPAVSMSACEDPSSDVEVYVLDGSDCDDAASDVHPGAVEVCDAEDVDEDCSGAADDGDPGVDLSTATRWYVDLDQDRFGDVQDEGTLRCDAPAGAPLSVVQDNTDCDDGVPGVNPDAVEVCDSFGVDENCNGLVDDRDPTLSVTLTPRWYLDGDRDGYGSNDDPGLTSCLDPSTANEAYVGRVGDCDDAVLAVNPDQTEICDPANTDEDCDGVVDDLDPSVDLSTAGWFLDADGDGYGDPTARACDDLSTGGMFYTDLAEDCDDTSSAVYPGAPEICDGVTNDCGAVGTVSEAGLAAFRDVNGAWTDMTGIIPRAVTGVPIPAATALAMEGPGELHLCEGNWVANITTTFDLELVGAGVGLTNLGTLGSGRPFLATGSGAFVGLSNLTLRSGRAANGGNVAVSDCASLTLTDVALLDGMATVVGGNAYVARCGSVEMSAVDMLNGSAAGGAGISLVDVGGFTAGGGRWQRNAATLKGGALRLVRVDSALLNRVTLDGNAAGQGGGIYALDAADLTLENVTIRNNTARDVGGGVAAEGASSVLVRAALINTNSSGGSGGALALVSGDPLVFVEASNFVANAATSAGGVALVLAGTLDVTGATLEANTPNDVMTTTPFNAPPVSPVAFTCTASGCFSAL